MSDSEVAVQAARFSNARLDELLEHQGRRNQWFAERLGVHESYVSKLRSGDKPLTEKLARSASEILDVPLSYFTADEVAHDPAA